MADGRKNNGGARKGAGRKKGIGITRTIQKHCETLIREILQDDAVRLKATEQLSLAIGDNTQNCLYLIRSEGKYKIGFSSNIKRRLKAYDTHLSKLNLVFCHYCSDAFELEQELHIMFDKKREKGEWFALADSDVVRLVEYCTNRIS